jgi:PBP1b-binding outer membrane lipoprotein LpoB
MTFKSGKIMNFKLGKSPLALAIVAAMLVGCGGGGSSSKPSTSTPPTNPTTPTDPTDPTTPTDPTDPTTPTDPTDPTKPVEKEPSVVDTNTTVAKVKVGVLDSGVVETESLKGSISSIKKYSFNTSTGEVTVTDLSNASANLQDNGNGMHGTFVSTIIAGSSVNGSAEGVANGVAEIYAAQTTENGIGTSYTKTFFLPPMIK